MARLSCLSLHRSCAWFHFFSLPCFHLATTMASSSVLLLRVKHDIWKCTTVKVDHSTDILRTSCNTQRAFSQNICHCLFMGFAKWVTISAYTVIFFYSLPMTFEKCYCNWHFADTFMNLSIFPQSMPSFLPSISKYKVHFWKISYITYS